MARRTASEPLVDLLVEDEGWTAALPDLGTLAADVAARGISAAGGDAAAVQFCLLATSDGVIANLNRDHRGTPAPTNVLSWPSFELAPDEDGSPPRPLPEPKPTPKPARPTAAGASARGAGNRAERRAATSDARAAARPAPARLFIGDVAIALQTVEAEARAAGRPLKDHAIHLILHGVLHLLGHDHARPGDAARMEGIEREVMESLGLPDPYLEVDVGTPRPDE